MIRRPGRRSSVGTAVPPYSDQQFDVHERQRLKGNFLAVP